MTSLLDEGHDFIVVPARSRLNSAMAPISYGDQLEQVIIGDRCHDAIVIYASDLGRAQAIATGLRADGHQLILIDVHATVAESIAEWRSVYARTGGVRPQNRLFYTGTVAGLKSYLTDLALIRMADGVILSVAECTVETRGVTSIDITDLVLAEFRQSSAIGSRMPSAHAV